MNRSKHALKSKPPPKRKGPTTRKLRVDKPCVLELKVKADFQTKLATIATFGSCDVSNQNQNQKLEERLGLQGTTVEVVSFTSRKNIRTGLTSTTQKSRNYSKRNARATIHFWLLQTIRQQKQVTCKLAAPCLPVKFRVPQNEWIALAEGTQRGADTGDTRSLKAFYEALKSLYIHTVHYSRRKLHYVLLMVPFFSH